MNYKSLEFCFKGERTYVHGTDIYNKLVTILSPVMKEENLDLSFHGVAEKNIRLLIEKPKDENLIKFVCKYIDIGGKKILFGVENEKSILCQYPYDENKITIFTALNKKNEEITLVNDSSFSFIENSVAMNKHLLENLFPNVEGKWYFTRLQMKQIVKDNIYPLKLKLKANFNFKLTKTEIYIDNTLVGYIYFSLV